MKVSVYGTAAVALATVGALACARPRCDEATGTCAGSATTVVALDQDVVLTPGRLVEVGTSGARLSFQAITTDSRCPTDVQCVWAGNATARVTVWGDAGVPRTVELNSSSEPKQMQVDGYLLRFVALTPDPVSTTRIEPAKYRLTVRLERAN